MAIYDYMTPFEEPEPIPVPTVVKPTHLEHEKHTGRPSISPDSECFDVSAAWYNHPTPFTVQKDLTTYSKTPHPVLLRHDEPDDARTPHQVLLRHDQSTQARTPHQVLSRHEVPELSHRPSSSSSTKQGETHVPHCSSCGLVRSRSGSIVEKNCSHMCPDIACERECPDTRSPTSADLEDARSHERPNNGHRRHSLMYEPTSSAAGYGIKAFRHESIPVGVVSDPLQEESNPLDQEANSLEPESHLLDQECTPLESAHDYEDPYYPGAEERLSRQKQVREPKSLGNAKVLSTTMSQTHDHGAGGEHDGYLLKTTAQVRIEENFYGKYI